MLVFRSGGLALTAAAAGLALAHLGGRGWLESLTGTETSIGTFRRNFLGGVSPMPPQGSVPALFSRHAGGPPRPAPLAQANCRWAPPKSPKGEERRLAAGSWGPARGQTSAGGRERLACGLGSSRFWRPGSSSVRRLFAVAACAGSCLGFAGAGIRALLQARAVKPALRAAPPAPARPDPRQGSAREEGRTRANGPALSDARARAAKWSHGVCSLSGRNLTGPLSEYGGSGASIGPTVYL